MKPKKISKLMKTAGQISLYIGYLETCNSKDLSSIITKLCELKRDYDNEIIMMANKNQTIIEYLQSDQEDEEETRLKSMGLS